MITSLIQIFFVYLNYTDELQVTMCYIVHNHGMAIEAHSRLFPLQPNVVELDALSGISVTAEYCRTRRNVILFFFMHTVFIDSQDVITSKGGWKNHTKDVKFGRTNYGKVKHYDENGQIIN